MIQQAIVLAGGFGKRLNPVIKELPKPLAPVAGKPFLHYVLRFLRRQGVKRVVLSTGYLHEKIENIYGQEFEGVNIVYSREIEPLGTGGGIKLALNHVQDPDVLVMNGDTFFDVDLKGLATQHTDRKADISMALKRVDDAGRYGTVTLTGERVTGFVEKGGSSAGLINGGIYAFKTDLFERFQMPERFSLENDFLAANLTDLRISGLVSESFFIDIGVPEELMRAQKEMAVYE